MGIEVVVAIAHPRIGRSFFLGNSIVFLMGWLLIHGKAIAAFNGLSDMLMETYFSLLAVGIASIAAYILVHLPDETLVF